MPTIDSRIISARVNNRKADEFEEYCRLRGTTPSKVMNDLIDSCLDGNEMEIDAIQYEGIRLIDHLRCRKTDEELLEWLEMVRKAK